MLPNRFGCKETWIPACAEMTKARRGLQMISGDRSVSREESSEVEAGVAGHSTSFLEESPGFRIEADEGSEVLVPEFDGYDLGAGIFVKADDGFPSVLAAELELSPQDFVWQGRQGIRLHHLGTQHLHGLSICEEHLVLPAQGEDSDLCVIEQ